MRASPPTKAFTNTMINYNLNHSRRRKKFWGTIDRQMSMCYDTPNRIQTVEAEITAVMPPQRARGAESRVGNKLSNGPLRVQSNGSFQSILQRGGIRQLPGMCRHPARAQGRTCENKVAPRISFYSSLTERDTFCQGRFLLPEGCIC